MKTYEYFINKDDGDDFYADVRDSEGNTVYEIKGYAIFFNGYMNHPEDLCNLADYLRDLNVLPHNSELTFG